VGAVSRGAKWWVADLAGHQAGDADVELDEFDTFFTDHDLWDILS
jgi:hypothetical protein